MKMKKRLVWVLAILLAVFIPACGGGGSEEEQAIYPGAVSGKVCELDFAGQPTATPVAGAVVKAFTDDTLRQLAGSSTTAPDGQFEITNLPLQQIYLQASKTSDSWLLPGSAQLQLSPSDPYGTSEIYMQRVPRESWVTGSLPGVTGQSEVVAYAGDGTENSRAAAGGSPSAFSLNIGPGNYAFGLMLDEGTSSQALIPLENVTGGNWFNLPAGLTLDWGDITVSPGLALPQSDPLPGSGGVTETFVPPYDFSGAWNLQRTITSSDCSSPTVGLVTNVDVSIGQAGAAASLTFPGPLEFKGLAVAQALHVIKFEAPSSSLTLYRTIDLYLQANGTVKGRIVASGGGGLCGYAGDIVGVRK